MKTSYVSFFFLLIIVPTQSATKIITHDYQLTTTAYEANVETCINQVFIHQPEHHLILNRILKNGDEGDCVIKTLSAGTVVAYYPNLGYQGKDTCTFDACEKLGVDVRKDKGRCMPTTLLIQVHACSEVIPIEVSTTRMVNLNSYNSSDDTVVVDQEEDVEDIFASMSMSMDFAGISSSDTITMKVEEDDQEFSAEMGSHGFD